MWLVLVFHPAIIFTGFRQEKSRNRAVLNVEVNDLRKSFNYRTPIISISYHEDDSGLVHSLCSPRHGGDSCLE